MATCLHPHRPHLHRPHVDRSLAAIVVLAAAVVALGVRVLVDRTSSGGVSTRAAAALIDKSCSAISRADAAALAALYTSDAVFVRDDGGKTVGAEGIGGLVAMTKSIQFRIHRVAPVSVSGGFATTFMDYTSTPLNGRELGVFEFKDGKILRQWIFRLGTTPPFGDAVVP